MTDTITLPRSVLEQAIESLQGYARETGDTQPCDAENALRAALAQQAESAPPPIVVNGRHVFDLDPSFIWLHLKQNTHFDADLMQASWNALIAIAKQSAQQAEQGWVRVPVEPTQEMINAGRTTPMPSDSEFDEDDDYRAVYKAMLAAAPKGGV